jgi:uncharacterized protein YhhL (DUF1145 family)
MHARFALLLLTWAVVLLLMCTALAPTLQPCVSISMLLLYMHAACLLLRDSPRTGLHRGCGPLAGEQHTLLTG